MTPIFEHGGESEREISVRAEIVRLDDVGLEDEIGGAVYVTKDCIDDEDDDQAALWGSYAYQLARELERRQIERGKQV